MFGGDLPVSHQTVIGQQKEMGNRSDKLFGRCQINLINEFLSAKGTRMTNRGGGNYAFENSFSLTIKYHTKCS